MNKIRYAFCCLIAIVFCTAGLFAGCGDPYANLRVRLSGDNLVQSSEENIYNLTLTKVDTDEDASWTTVVDVTLEGLDKGMLSSVIWNYDARYLNIEYLNNERTSARITGVTSTDVGSPTVVEVISEETSTVSAKINVTNIVEPKSVIGTRFNTGEFGIPLDIDYSLNVKEIFRFDPDDATPPEYTFEINGFTVQSGQVFNLAEDFALQDGLANVLAYPTNRDAYTDEEFSSLTYTIENVRLYSVLTEENTKILTMDTQEEVTEVELIKNSSENEVILSLDTITDVVVEATASDSSVLYDEINNSRGALSVTYNQNAHTITLIGYGSLEEWTDITFNISVAGIINSEVLQITIRVRIVDIPDVIYINGDRGTEEVSLRVFDAYANNILGTELRVSLSPSSQVYNNVLITLDSENTDDVTLFSNLLINDTAFNGEYRFKSGDTLYLRNTGGNGQIALWVYAEDVMGTPDEVRRHLIINLEQGVTEISVPQGILDSESQNLILQLDEYEISDYSIKRLQFNVQPTTASKDTVTVTSANENIVRVNRVDLDEGIIEVYAVSPGTTTLNFIAESGARYSLTVEVLVNLNQFSVNLSSTTSNAYIGPNETQSITVGSEEEHTLLYAYITSNSRISLTNAFYPNTVVTQNLIRRITFETTDSNRANAYNSSSNIYLDYLETSADGEVTITMTVEYTTLETQGLTPGVNKVIGRLTTSFDVRVFVPIDRIEVSETNVSLLAGLTTGSGGSSQQSAYDLENNSRTLRVNVYPSNSYIQADNAVWQVVENTSRLSIDREIGGETTATAAPMGSLDNTQITATVVVTVTDLNGIPYSREIRVVITKITRITDVYIDGYDDATRNSVGLYFEPFKEGRDSFELDVSVAPSNATNKNLEYIIFDAERLDSAATGDNIVRIDTGRLNDAGGRIYEYYRVVDRTNTAIYENQYVSNTAALTYDEATGNYTIEPLNAGYAFVFIMPQDIMQVKVDEITSLTAQLRDISNTSTIKRILITVADGEVVPFQLYTAEDVDSIRNGLDKNYTLMNTIDMSTYLIRNPNWIPIGSEEEPFSGTIQSVGFDDLGTTAVEQNIVGWTLSRDLNETNPAQDPNHLMNYGIFGVVTGSIKNINFYVNSYTINQTTCRNNLDGQAGSLNDYKFGVLAGWLREGGEIDNVGVYCTNLTYIANTSTQTNDLYVNIGMVGMADLNSSITNVSSQITANLQSNDLIINFGGVVGQNNGQIGIDNNNNVFDILSNVTVNANITYTNSSKLVNNAFGGVVGINVGSGIVNSANATGQINANNVSHATVGGIAGYNSASLRDALSAVIMQSAGNLGGVVGTNENGTLNYVYYEIYDLASTNCGLIGSGNTGGIVGVMRGGTLSRAIVQGYNRTSEEYNIVSTGGVFGGLIGLVEGNISIQNSFVNAGISTTGGVAGGLVGENAIQSSLNIVNVYTRGLFNVGQSVQAGALIGESRNVGLNYVYAEFDNDLNVVGGGTLSSPAGVVILINGSDSVSTNGVRYLNKNSANATDLGYWSNLGFSISNTNTSMTWNIDLTSSPDEKINDGYPYLRDSDGTDFVRIIPEEIILNAKSFNNFNEDGKINSILNITDDDKKLILAYQETNYYLSDLFDLTTDPVLDVSSLNIQISCNSNTAIRLYSGTNYYDARIGIIGTGTAVITFTSSQNNSARDAIQICVVNGFDVGCLAPRAPSFSTPR